jgi:hypothetical protein
VFIPWVSTFGIFFKKKYIKIFGGLIYLCIFDISNKAKHTNMNVVVNNIKNEDSKLIMQKLMICIKDKSIDIKERNFYYSQYLQIAKNLLISSK